ncbi:hypothetical protein ALC57_16486 [Trachymyrmex cornetzi]|uniref:Uncharacterized protein n=3 Tax=Trachymyrmex cornetzi TaxID=471704 RepID=A0A151IV02_9HYME|nr:hypothetical protein ALC57_16486 [Trachymyrmex cornetzi]
MNVRKTLADNIKKSFHPDVPLTVHWDGKLLPSLTSKNKVERLAISVTGEGVEKLLGVPAIALGIGKTQADVVYKTLQEWNLSDTVTSMCFDTTASNTGKNRGACVELEKKLGHELFSLACRHHIHELIVGSVFDILFGPSSGPNIKIFQRFQESWESIDQEKYESALKDKKISTFLAPIQNEMIDFIRNQLLLFQPREDYKELLILSLIFLGAEDKIKIRSPGAYHRARWMAKLIYCMKIYLFRSLFKVRASELSGLRQFNLFLIKIYLKKWYTSQCPILAPVNDLELLKDLIQYKSINPTVSKAAYDTFSRHLWYLSDSLAGLSLFDSRISNEERKKMTNSLRKDGTEIPPKRIIVDKDTIDVNEISDFITENSKQIFITNGISLNFLHKDPSLWEENEEFIKSRYRIGQLKVVNDVAERGVSLIQNFNSVLTKQEEQKQYLLQVVEYHRREKYSFKKSVNLN